MKQSLDSLSTSLGHRCNQWSPEIERPIVDIATSLGEIVNQRRARAQRSQMYGVAVLAVYAITVEVLSAIRQELRQTLSISSGCDF
jgi:hypothetical protein